MRRRPQQRCEGRESFLIQASEGAGFQGIHVQHPVDLLIWAEDRSHGECPVGATLRRGVPSRRRILGNVRPGDDLARSERDPCSLTCRVVRVIPEDPPTGLTRPGILRGDQASHTVDVFPPEEHSANQSVTAGECGCSVNDPVADGCIRRLTIPTVPSRVGQFGKVLDPRLQGRSEGCEIPGMQFENRLTLVPLYPLALNSDYILASGLGNLHPCGADSTHRAPDAQPDPYISRLTTSPLAKVGGGSREQQQNRVTEPPVPGAPQPASSIHAPDYASDP